MSSLFHLEHDKTVPVRLHTISSRMAPDHDPGAAPLSRTTGPLDSPLPSSSNGTSAQQACKSTLCTTGFIN